MRIVTRITLFVLSVVTATLLTSCAHVPSGDRSGSNESYSAPTVDYAYRLPQHINTGEKTVLVDPTVHAWGAYGSDGELIKAGLATAGSDYCPDLHRRCHTGSGSFRVYSLGSPYCKSSMFPMPHGGAPMPYCMFFNRNQALHGSPEGEVVEGNISHGCVRLHVADAEWLRYNFVNVGTKVVVKPY